MNIILINHYAGSSIHGMEYRPFHLAREWVRAGHKVSIVAASFSHLHAKKPNVNGIMTKEEIDGIQYIWLKTPKYQGNGIRRVFNMIIFSLLLLIQKSYILRNNKPDLIVASSPHPFIIFGARSMARSSNAKLVFEVRDLWPLTLVEIGSISQAHPIVKVMNLSEKYAYRVSDHVVSLLPKADSYMKKHGMSPDKFSCIPNGTDVKEWLQNSAQLPDQHQKLLSKLKERGYFIVGYAGGHGISNALDHVIKAAEYLKSEPVALVLVGKGPEKINLEQQSSDMGLRNVAFLPPVAKSSIPSLLKFMDVMFIGWRRSALYRFGISPNKLLDYMMSGKPVIHSIDAANDLVAESGCGLSVPPENPEAIAKAIMDIRNMSESARKELGLKGKNYVEKHHDYAVLAKNFLAILNE